jgi:hypothetical protein
LSFAERVEFLFINACLGLINYLLNDMVIPEIKCEQPVFQYGIIQIRP